MEMTITPAPGRRASLYYMRGDNKTYIARNLDLSDGPSVQKVVDNARHNYPTLALKLTVFQMNGNARKEVETINVSSPALAGAESDEMTHVATRPPVAVAAPPLPGGMDNTTTFILQTVQNQVAEKDSQIFDLRDDKKRLDEQVRTLERKVMDLEFEIKHKDKEKEYAVNDALAGVPKGLSGIGEVVGQFPPETINMLVAKFLGASVPTGPAAPQLGAHLSEGQRQIIQYLTECASESEERAAKIYAIVSQGVSNAGGLEQLITYCQTTFPQLRAA